MASSLTNNNKTFTIESAHVLRLIQAYLTECGFHRACRTLRETSGVGGAGVVGSEVNLFAWAKTGQWGRVLTSLSSVDGTYVKNKSALMASVHEMTMLELGEEGQVELAYATLRLVQDELDHEWKSRKNAGSDTTASMIPPSRDVEQRLAALVALRGTTPSSGARNANSLPPNYYGHGGITKQSRRDLIGNQLMESIPIVPHSRLTTLLQQAIKWQAHTGQVPYVKQYWEEEQTQEENQDDDTKKRSKKRKRKQFDLVLGEVSSGSTVVVGEGDHDGLLQDDSSRAESIPSGVYSTIKFGKKATVESALFFPNGSGLVTGSSDGLIEIWDSSHKYTKLSMDLAYQQEDDFLFHNDDAPILALALSHDGTLLASGDGLGCIKVWRVDTSGKCLREFTRAHDKAISSLAFSHDASHVLSGSHDYLCREYGLRTSRLLKEFRGHDSYVNSCQYVLSMDASSSDDDETTRLHVVTGSADGTVRVWDGKTSEVQFVLQPSQSTMVGASIQISHDQANNPASFAGVTSNVHSVLSLHTPPNALLVVPRGSKAFLVTLTGTVLRVYNEGNDDDDYVMATVSPSNSWLYAVTQKGSCHVYNVKTGKLKQTIRNFAESSTSKGKSGAPITTEISGLIHHPHKSMLGGFSNDKKQKRGLLTLWK